MLMAGRHSMLTRVKNNESRSGILMSSFRLRLSRTKAIILAIGCGIAVGIVFYMMRLGPTREAILDAGVVMICQEAHAQP